MKLEKEDVVAIEGYAFCAKGKVFNIAEATYALKEKIYENGNKLRIYEPTTIKKFSTEIGNADKEKMNECFIATNHDYVLEHLPSGSPREDIIDAFYVCKLLQTELKLRKGLIQLKELSEKQIECFNQASKSNPENILVRKFIERR
jgi:Holliday junction resolvasome RuvABC endonuclease subunit